MVNSADKVISGAPAVAGGVLAGPRSATAPTSARATIAATIKALGYVSDSGLERTEDRTTADIRDWAGLLVKRKQTGFSEELTFAFLEYLNPDAAKTIYGEAAVTVEAANATAGNRMAIAVKGAEAPHLLWVWDMVDGSALVRLVAKDGQVTATDTIGYTVEGAALRTVTVTCYPDADGVFVTEYTDDGKITV